MKYKSTIIGGSLPNLPWENRKGGALDVIWRYTNNPVIKRNAIAKSNSIFNSAVVPFNGIFAGVFRCDHKTRIQYLHKGASEDGINFKIDEEPINFVCEDPELESIASGYDPRVCFIEDRYYITWCKYYHGPTIGVAYTFDFETFYRIENAFLPHNRNGVMFPRKINGKFAMISRPSDNAHTAFGDIFYSESPDMTYWGCHRHVMSPIGGTWQSTKVGGGPTPIETTEGWLMIYHGVLYSCNGFVYSMGAAILDIDKPWIVKYRTAPYLMCPETIYECVGDVPNVVFPCSTLYDAPTGRISIYYGAADTVTCLAFTQVDELIAFIKANSIM